MWPFLRNRETSQLAGWALYGYCASHTRFSWSLRLHPICTLHGLPLGWALVDAKADERGVAATMLATTPALSHRPVTLIGDKNYHGKAFEAELADTGVTLPRPARKGENP